MRTYSLFIIMMIIIIIICENIIIRQGMVFEPFGEDDDDTTPAEQYNVRGRGTHPRKRNCRELQYCTVRNRDARKNHGYRSIIIISIVVISIISNNTGSDGSY